MSETPEASSKDKILDAAEKAFADVGFDGASLRQIVAAAGVNLATVYYYFDSKEALLDAVMERRVAPLKREPLARLQELRQQTGGKLEPEVILHLMLESVLAVALPGSEQSLIAVRRLLGRMIMDPTPAIQQRLCTRHEVFRTAFFEAFQQALPHLPPKDLFWRLEFVWGAMGMILCNPNWAADKAYHCSESVDAETVLPQMIAFFAAGLRAAPLTPPENLPNPTTVP